MKFLGRFLFFIDYMLSKINLLQNTSPQCYAADSEVLTTLILSFQALHKSKVRRIPELPLMPPE
jgi:hypothetical protein